MIALLCYHKNLYTYAKREWIKQYKDSILYQSNNDFDIYELNYGGGEERIFYSSSFYSKQFPNFVAGLNFLLDKCFSLGYDYVFNTNIDDWYDCKFIETELAHIISQKLDLVSCNFSLTNADGSIYQQHRFHNFDITHELGRGHNIIAHPAVVYSRNFWKKHRYVPDEIPEEDMKLWQRAIKNCKFGIVPENLLYHRIHDNAVCRSENR